MRTSQNLPHYLSEIMEAYSSNDLSAARRVLNEIISFNGDVLHSLRTGKVKINKHEVYIEALIKKIIYTSNSICKISESQKLSSLNKKEGVEIIDIPSINILTRSIIESYLTLEYLYFNKESEEEKIFRYNIWKISGLMSRQGFNPEDKELKDKKANERKQIEELLSIIKESPKYNRLKPHQKKNLERFGNPRINSWGELLSLSKLRSSIFNISYSLYSNYAHSEYLSIIQIHENSNQTNSTHTIDGARLGINHAIMINSICSIDLKMRYKSAEIIFNNLPDRLQKTVEYFKEMGT